MAIAMNGHQAREQLSTFQTKTTPEMGTSTKLFFFPRFYRHLLYFYCYQLYFIRPFFLSELTHGPRGGPPAPNNLAKAQEDLRGRSAAAERYQVHLWRAEGCKETVRGTELAVRVSLSEGARRPLSIAKGYKKAAEAAPSKGYYEPRSEGALRILAPDHLAWSEGSLGAFASGLPYMQ